MTSTKHFLPQRGSRTLSLSKVIKPATVMRHTKVTNLNDPLACAPPYVSGARLVVPVCVPAPLDVRFVRDAVKVRRVHAQRDSAPKVGIVVVNGVSSGDRSAQKLPRIPVRVGVAVSVPKPAVADPESRSPEPTGVSLVNFVPEPIFGQHELFYANLAVKWQQ